MKLTDLLEEFKVVIDTPEGLNELRSLILGLAMAGKLSIQNEHESVDDEIQKYDLRKDGLYPNNWTCVKGKYIVDTQNGYAFKSKQFNDVGHGMPLIRIRDLFSVDTQAYYEGEFSDDYIVYQDDLLVGMDGNFNVALWQGPDALLNQRVCRIFPKSKYLKKKLLYYFIQKFLNDIHEETTYTTVKHLSAKQIKSIKFPLPPLTEQHRIVQNIESLFTEVDELEEKLNLQSKLDEKLQLAVNAEVQQAPDAEASKTAWNFITSNFDTLYHTPEAIDNLKKSILNEAVRGRLVLQNPNDEPASELLKKIEAEKQRLYEEGEIRKPKDLPTVKEDEMPFEIPKSWEWCRFGDLASTVEYGTSQKAHKEPDGIPVLRMGNIDVNGNMIFDSLKYVKPDIKDLPRLYLKNDDLIFNRTNSYELVGKMGLFKKRDKRFTLASYLIRSTLLTDIYPEYIYYYFNSLQCRVNEIEPEITKQTNQANFNGTKLQHVRVPLPAKEEQHRIVQRIEELFAICDRYKAQLEQREKVNGRLVKGLVQEVLEGSSDG